jgi:DNA repair protein RadD
VRQTLRDYQARGWAQILDAYRGGAKSVLAVAPTGSGKTTLFGHGVAELDESGLPSLILVHRRELAAQAANRLREFGVQFGFIMAGEVERRYARVQIAMVQSLSRRTAPPARFVICDEAHLSTAKTWASVLAHYPDARILGVTATPWRLSGKPLAGAYDACVVVATPRELREQGHLCDYVGFSYLAPDLSKVKTTGGDYNERESAAAMSQSIIVDTIVEEWGKHARDLSTIVFAVTVEHSRQLTDRFRAAGVAAEHLDGSTPLEQRKAILRRVEEGTTRVLCNVGVAVEGLDIPRLKCCILARPTKSLARAIQMAGRVRRPWNGIVARIHDHAFVIKAHGLPDADRDYTLNAKPEKPPALTQCEECFALYSGPTCPACNHENKPKLAGERVLATVAEAEQFSFDSGTTLELAAPEPEQRPERPTVIRWETPGRVVEGRFVKSWEERREYGPQRMYQIASEKRDYVLPGTRHLDSLMARCQTTDSMIRVTYLGEHAIPGAWRGGVGRHRKLFKVEINHGA